MNNALSDYLCLCKPNVVLLMLLTTLIGMCLASPTPVLGITLLWTLLGVGCASSAAAIMNHIIDRHLDRKMSRTQFRPLATERIPLPHALGLSLFLGLTGLVILFVLVNPLTATLTALSVLGYAIFYTGFLKRYTPQNIVIGGIAGAMPPLLGWTAITNEIHAQAWLLVLIIFAWTPPHFWALAIAKEEDYARAKIPMLPITHGVYFTKLQLLLYTILLIIATLLPYVTHLSGALYLISALGLNIALSVQTWRLWRTHSKAIAYQTFRFSITYLLLLFIAMLLDHFLRSPL